MMNTILLPVDLSNPSSADPALRRAVELVGASSGTLHVVSVVPDFGTALVSDFFPKEFEKEASQRAMAALETFRKEKIGTDIETKLHLVHGPVAEKM